MRRRRFVRDGVVTLTAFGCGSGGSDSDGGDGSGTDTSDAASSAGSSGGSGGASDAGSGTDGPGDTSGTGGDPTSGTTAPTGTGTAEPPACPPTAADIEGPFYREGIPIGGTLDVHGDEGIALLLSGIVSDGDCVPLENAVVELWHATPRTPDGQPGDVDATYDDTGEYRYYGQVATDAEGRYTFETLLPGWYLNGAEYRPAHLHLKVWVGGSERLTTQLYFAGDPFNDADPWYNPDNELDPDPDGNATYDLFV